MARCISPIRIRNPSKISFYRKTKPFIDVPCGKCLYCLQRRSNNFAFRISCEIFCARIFNPLFITLTYDEDNIPIAFPIIGSVHEDGYLSESDFYFFRGRSAPCPPKGTEISFDDCRDVLRRRDFTLYIKRVRRAINLRVRYFGCGEYGQPAGIEVKRPHFHLLLWSMDDDQERCKNFCLNDLWSVIMDSWPYGYVTIESVNSARIHYCAKYCNGKYFTDTPFNNNQLFRPFIATSQGLGTCYLTPEMKKYIYDNIDHLSYLPVNGEHFALPRYIKDKLSLNYLQREKYNNHCLEIGIKRDIVDFNNSSSYSSIGHMKQCQYEDFVRQTKNNLLKRGL